MTGRRFLYPRRMGAPSSFPLIFTKGNYFCNFLFAAIDDKPFLCCHRRQTLSKLGCTLEKVLIRKQILFFKSWSSLKTEKETKITELFSLRMCPFTLMLCWGVERLLLHLVDDYDLCESGAIEIDRATTNVRCYLALPYISHLLGSALWYITSLFILVYTLWQRGFYYLLYQIRSALFSFFFLPHIERSVKYGLTL